MNVLIDTNVVLDDILDRAPSAESARKISQLATVDMIQGFITANSLTDIFYIVTKNRDETTARKIIRNLLLVFSVVSVDGDDCQDAIDLPMSDFEDALIVVCAEKANLDYIITNDRDFLSNVDLSVPAICPSDFLLKVQNY